MPAHAIHPGPVSELTAVFAVPPARARALLAAAGGDLDLAAAYYMHFFADRDLNPGISEDPEQQDESDASDSESSDDGRASAPTTPLHLSPNYLNPRYKTVLCRHYIVEGQCMYGSRCKFAHGDHELRQLSSRSNDWASIGRARRSTTPDSLPSPPSPPPPAPAAAPAAAPPAVPANAPANAPAGAPAGAPTSSPALSSSGTVPTTFLCPITQDVLTDPVICADGHTYERAAITRWLAVNSTSPNTNLRLVRHTGNTTSCYASAPCNVRPNDSQCAAWLLHRLTRG